MIAALVSTLIIGSTAIILAILYAGWWTYRQYRERQRILREFRKQP